MRDDAIDMTAKARAMLPLSEATYLILLSLTEPQHGYGIMQTVARLDSRVKLGPGTLYGAINNLLKLRVIERTGESESPQGRRKCYALTPLGRTLVEVEHERLESLVWTGRRILKRMGDANE